MSPDALAARLAALERSHRRLRALLAALALSFAAVLLLGAGGAGSDGALVGKSLKLLDEQGRLRVLATTNSGLSFMDPSGRVRAVIGLDGTGAPGVVLNGDASRAIFNVNADGPALTFMGDRGVLRAVLGLVKGQPGLVFFDGEDHERARFAVVDGSGHAFLRAADGGTTWRVPDDD